MAMHEQSDLYFPGRGCICSSNRQSEYPQETRRVLVGSMSICDIHIMTAWLVVEPLNQTKSARSGTYPRGCRLSQVNFAENSSETPYLVSHQYDFMAVDWEGR